MRVYASPPCLLCLWALSASAYVVDVGIEDPSSPSLPAKVVTEDEKAAPVKVSASAVPTAMAEVSKVEVVAPKPPAAATEEESSDDGDEDDDDEKDDDDEEEDDDDDNDDEGADQEDDETDDQENGQSSQDQSLLLDVLDSNNDGKLTKTEVLKLSSGKNKDPKEQMDMRENLEAAFPKLDKNSDSSISGAEIPALMEWMENEEDKALFNKLDSNKDGKLHPDEIFSQEISRDPKNAEKMLAHFQDHLPQIDKDGDKLINLPELPGLVELSDDFERQKKREMSLSDKSSDDDEARGEVRDAEESNDETLKRLDTSKDGKLSKEEIFSSSKASPKERKSMLDHFEKNIGTIDKDKDNLISMSEMEGLKTLSASYEKQRQQSLAQNVGGEDEVEEEVAEDEVLK